MNKGTLFITPLGARNKKETVYKEIVSLHPENDYLSVLYLGPNNFILSEAKSQFFSYLKKNHNKSAYIPFQSLTIKQLALNLHESFGGNNLISERIRTLILCEILKEKNIGYARLLSELLKKTRHYILDKDLSQLKEDVRKLIFEEKAADRAVKAIEILESYEDELTRKKLIDPEDMLKNSITLIKEYFNQSTERRHNPPISPFKKAGLINTPPSAKVDTTRFRGGKGGFTNTDKKKGFSLFELDTLVIDGFFDPTPLEMEIIKTLMDKACNVYILAEEDTELFNYFKLHKSGIVTKRLERTLHREKTGYYSYPSMEEEVEGIAKGIKRLVLEGVNPWEITVCFPVLSKYLPMFRRIFRKHGIPVSIGEYNLSLTRPFVALEEMIACIEEDYPRNDFLGFLTSPHFPLIPNIIKEWTVTNSYRAGIVKGKQSWLSIKEILLNSLNGEVSEDDKERLNEFQRGIKLVIDTIESIKQKKDIFSFIDAFESALIKFGFFDSLDLAGSTQFGNEISNKINSQFSELRNFAGLYKTTLDSYETPVFYLRQLLQGLKGVDENRDGVEIIPFELAAGIETKALFFGGMLEGDFPSRPDIDPILPEKIKKSLGIPDLEYYLNRQRLYFKRLLNISIHDPIFSCPSADGDKVFLPSPFLEWGEIINPVDMNIFTEEEVLIREGSVKQIGLESKVFWDVGTTYSREEMFLSKKALYTLNQRIGLMSRGFFSVTDIDYYRKCPLRFYIEKVLCLDIEMPPRFEVESRLWGSLAHKTMEYLFKDRDIELDVMDKKIFQGLEKSLKQFPVGDFWSRVAKEIFQKLLPMLKEQETDIRMKGFSPYMVEKKLKAETNNLKLKGKIDRIDLKAEGRRQNTKAQRHKGTEAQRTKPATGDTVILLDYKTGAVDSDSLQMPLYARMWQENFSEPVEKTGFYSLKEGRISWYPKKVGMIEFMQDALQRAEGLVEAMRKGIFPAKPIKATECRYCYHSPLCNSSN